MSLVESLQTPGKVSQDLPLAKVLVSSLEKLELKILARVAFQYIYLVDNLLHPTTLHQFSSTHLFAQNAVAPRLTAPNLNRP